jgi:hypothetical protein
VIARFVASSVAAFVVGTTAVGCSVFGPAPITDDLSTWSVVPLPPDPRFVQLAASRCGDPDAGVGAFGVVLQDRRTASTSALLMTAGPLHGSCFLTLATGGGGSSSSDQQLDPISGPIAVDEQSSGGVADGTAALLGGRAGPQVQRVLLTMSDGRVVTASLGTGHWLAWWPSSLGATKLVALGADGGVLASIDNPAAAGPTK